MCHRQTKSAILGFSKPTYFSHRTDNKIFRIFHVTYCNLFTYPTKVRNTNYSQVRNYKSSFLSIAENLKNCNHIRAILVIYHSVLSSFSTKIQGYIGILLNSQRILQPCSTRVLWILSFKNLDFPINKWILLYLKNTMGNSML